MLIFFFDSVRKTVKPRWRHNLEMRLANVKQLHMSVGDKLGEIKENSWKRMWEKRNMLLNVIKNLWERRPTLSCSSHLLKHYAGTAHSPPREEHFQTTRYKVYHLPTARTWSVPCPTVFDTQSRLMPVENLLSYLQHFQVLPFLHRAGLAIKPLAPWYVWGCFIERDGISLFAIL